MAPDPTEPRAVDGKRLLLTLLMGAVATAALAAASWWVQSRLLGVDSSLKQQIVTIQVYGVLVGALILGFHPPKAPPLSLHAARLHFFALAPLALSGVIAASAVVYVLLSPLVGGVEQSARQVLSIATDVKWIGSAPLHVWLIAILRGTFVVPLFEELLFRGALLGWLAKHWPQSGAIAASAGLFALMHGFPIVMPYAFLFGLVAGWLRVRSGSTLPGLFAHALNNALFLAAGILILK